MPTTLPGVSSTKMREILGQTNRVIKTVPEVESVFGKAGRADTATDPAPLTMIESWIKLKPKSEWRAGMTADGIVDDLNSRKIRMDMVSTGIRTPIGIKVTGDDLTQIEAIAREIEGVVTNIPGTRSAFADRVLGGKYLEITPNRLELARRNIDMGAFQSVIQTALGGMTLAESVQGRERYNIMLRYERAFRETDADIGNILIPTPTGAHIPLREVASVAYTEGPPMIRSENARLTGWVFVDIAGRDLGGYVAEAKDIVANAVTLPPGYAIGWSGQYEQLQRANERLKIAIPAAIGLIFLLRLVGGLWAVYLAGYNLSVAVAVGFIALGGIAVETAVVMLLYIDQQVRTDSPMTRADLFQSVSHGAALRVRPKLMTVLTVMAGLAPIFLTEGLGSDVETSNSTHTYGLGRN